MRKIDGTQAARRSGTRDFGPHPDRLATGDRNCREVASRTVSEKGPRQTYWRPRPTGRDGAGNYPASRTLLDRRTALQPRRETPEHDALRGGKKRFDDSDLVTVVALCWRWPIASRQVRWPRLMSKADAGRHGNGCDDAGGHLLGNPEGVRIRNEFFIPLIVAFAPDAQTMRVGSVSFIGAYSTEWCLAFSKAVNSRLPVVIACLLIATKFQSGLTAGAAN